MRTATCNPSPTMASSSLDSAIHDPAQDGTAIALSGCVASPMNAGSCDGLEPYVAAQPVEREVERLKERVTRLEELPARVDDLTGQILQLRGEMGSAFSAMSDRIDGLSGRMDTLTGQMDVM